MSMVVDNSVTMAWVFTDEATEYTESVLQRLRDDSMMEPAIWALEVSNVLLLGERRRRISQSQSVQFLEVLSELPISVEDSATMSRAFAAVIDVGRTYELTSYDASYLELAMRRGLPLATLDGKLRQAAGNAGVALVE